MRAGLIEVQAGGEEATFTPEQLQEMLKLGQKGIAQITEMQQRVKVAAQTYLSRGNTAIKADDWAEF